MFSTRPRRRQDEHTRRARQLTRKIESWEMSPLEAGLRLSGLMKPDERFTIVAVGFADSDEYSSELVIWNGDEIVRRIPYRGSEEEPDGSS